MFEEKGMIDQPNPTLKIGHFSYDYIGNSKDEKDLGNIILIPRANKEWTNKQDDGLYWNKPLCIKELKLTERNNNNDEPVSTEQSRDMVMTLQEVTEKNETSTIQEETDYRVQSKFHADSKLMKMELEQKIQEQDEENGQEREKQSMRDKEEKKRQLRQVEINRLNAVIKNAEKLSDSERQILAEREKERGNQCYEQKEFDNAIECYTASIRIFPTPKAYNNRAACYLKQCKYAAALDDANLTLEMDPNNVKALFRRGVALNHKNEFKLALDDMKAVLTKQPKHVLAQHMSRELREQIQFLPKNIRVMHDEGFNKPKRVMELSPEEAVKVRFNRRCYEVNERNLPRVMCECSSSPKFLHSLSPKAPMVTIFQAQAPTMPSTSRILEVADEPQVSKPPTKIERTDTFKPKKCAVVRERTLLKASSSNNNNNEVSDNQLSTKCTPTRESPPNSARAETAEEEDIEHVSN